MSEITLVVEFAIKAGQGDGFEATAARMRALVEAEEPGTLRYDWWRGRDGARAMIIETFTDSAALVWHMEHTAPLLPELVATADVARVEVLGELDEAAHGAIDAAATGWFRSLGGIAR